jgi:chromosome segregation ATPase
MTAEQITTIITNVLSSGGVAVFLWMVIKGLKAKIGGLQGEITILNETIKVQKQTLEAMETRVVETEKVGNIYKQLTEELPIEIEKYKALLTKLKDDQITALEKANQQKDDRLKETAEIEIGKLELQERALNDIPQLRDQLINVVSTLEQRLLIVNQLSAGSEVSPKPTKRTVAEIRDTMDRLNESVKRTIAGRTAEQAELAMLRDLEQPVIDISKGVTDQPLIAQLKVKE